MTSRGSDQKAVKKNYFPQVGDHRVKKISSIGQEMPEKKHFEKPCGHTHRQTNKPSHRILPDNKGCLKRAYQLLCENVQNCINKKGDITHCHTA